MEQMPKCISTLKERLAGNYKLAVDDGLGPLDGSDVFTRQFPVSPIMTEALERIEALEKVLREVKDKCVGSIQEAPMKSYLVGKGASKLYKRGATIRNIRDLIETYEINNELL